MATRSSPGGATSTSSGRSEGIETRLVPPTGFPHTFLDVRRRAASAWPRQPVVPAEAVSGHPPGDRAPAHACAPRVVVSVGGYASLPAVLAARRLRIPIVVVSYDRRPGRATQPGCALRLPPRAVAFPGSTLPRARADGRAAAPDDPATSTRRATARRRAPSSALPADRFVLLVVGGSLGSGAAQRRRRRAFVAAVERPERSRRPPRRRRTVPRHATQTARPRRPGRRRHPVRRGRLRGAHAAGLRRGRPGAGARRGQHRGRARRPSACRRSSCRGRAPPRITRPPTRARSPPSGAAVLLPESELTAARLVAEVDRAAGRSGRAVRDGGARPGRPAAIHRGGRARRELVEEVAGG